jgi:endonuclease/exonuclease/phosphatase family metal-dependent hydrolase
MAEFYTEGVSRNKRRSNRELRNGKDLALLILDVLVVVLMIILVITSLIAVICQFVSPEKSGVLSVVSLAAPILYLLDLVVMFYWVVRLRWYHALTMAIVVIIGLFNLSKYYNLDIDRVYETSYKERKYTKIMTYNVRDGRVNGLVEYIASHNPDILCLQEINVKSDNWELLQEKYKTTFDENNISNNQILTKYKMIRRGEIEGLALREGVWADLRIKDDTVRVLSLHLKSTSISPRDTEFLEKHKYILDSERESKLRSIIHRLVENNQKRAVQAEAVATFMKSSPYKIVVCGDFNDVPLSYTYRTIAKRLDDTFSKKASGFACTYNTLYKLLRIDNILVSSAIEVVTYDVDNKVELSDHYPVISRVIINNK